MERRWRIRPHDEVRIAALERAAGVSPVVAKLLLARGIGDPEQANSFLDAKLTGLRDPELLPGLTAAADRVHAAVQQGRRIIIYGDYDADGMTATGLLFCCLRLLGGERRLLRAQPAGRRLRPEHRRAAETRPARCVDGDFRRLRDRQRGRSRGGA